MYVSPRIAFVQMHKTGCTHIADLLMKYDGGTVVDKHKPLTSNLARERLTVASIRNPWSWYVSLWAYGCASKGRLWRHLTDTPASKLKRAVKRRSVQGIARTAFDFANAGKRRGIDFAELYADPYNKENFRRWLSVVLGDSGRALLPEGYPFSRLNAVCGLMSYRFLKFSFDPAVWKRDIMHHRDPSALRSAYEEKNIIDEIILNEALESGVRSVLARVGIEVTEEELNGMRRTNASRHGQYLDYYDDEARSMVEDRERFITERFGYRFGS